MKPQYTVIWSEFADRELADFWLRVTDRKSFARIIDEFDALLRFTPEAAAAKRQKELRAAILPGLRIIYSISEDDRIVNVLAINETH